MNYLIQSGKAYNHNKNAILNQTQHITKKEGNQMCKEVDFKLHGFWCTYVFPISFNNPEYKRYMVVCIW